jgi:anti-sigma-K factor RsiG
MGVPATTSGFLTLSNGDLCAMLDEAERDERLLSARRRELHAVIDNAVDGPDRDVLVQRERVVSSKRLELHARITDLRSEKSRRLNSLRAPLRPVGN